MFQAEAALGRPVLLELVPVDPEDPAALLTARPRWWRFRMGGRWHYWYRHGGDEGPDHVYSIH